MGTTRGSGAIPRHQMVKPIDAWWTVLFVDPIATRIVPPLTRVHWVTPGRVTGLAHVLGVVAAVLLANGQLLAGAIAFEARFVADCVDGKLARVTGRSSEFGRLWDAYGDRLIVTVLVAVLAWRYEPLAAVILAGAYPLSHNLFEVRDQLVARSGATKPIDRIVGRGWGAVLAEHRLNPMPTSVDVEHVLLFCGPVLWALGIDVLEALIWGSAAYFVLQCARYAASMLRAAARLDRHAVEPGVRRNRSE